MPGFACPLCDTIKGTGWKFSVAIVDQDSGRISQQRHEGGSTQDIFGDQGKL